MLSTALRAFKRFLVALQDRDRSRIALRELLVHHERLTSQYETLKLQYQELQRSQCPPSTPVLLSPTSFETALARLKARDTQINTVIDVGASNGQWSREVLPWLSQAHYLLFECDEQHRQQLAQFCQGRPNFQPVWAAASDSAEPVFLSEGTPDSGKVGRTAWKTACHSVPATTIDAEVAVRGLSGPFFLKLDVHGYERPILQGAARTLENTELLMIEMYNFTLGGGDGVRFPAMCQYLEELGFRPLYICDPLHRPLDGALFQFDLIFARKDSPEFHFEGWR